MTSASEKLQVILELVTGQYKREADSAARATSQIARAADAAGLSTARLDQAMTTTGRAMVGFGAVAIGSLGLAAKAAVDWESAFAGVRKTVEASEPEFAALEQGLLDISLVAPVSAEELAGIAEAAGQLGIKNDAILDFTESMAALGVTTNLTADEAATAFARIANILQIPQDQFDEMGSTVVELGNKLAATERDITDFATRIAGAGKIAGLTAADVFAIGGAFSSVGVEAEAGGTAVQKVLLDMTESVATSGGNLETFARVSGVTAQEFITLWESNPAEAFTKFVEGLGRAGDDAFTILQELGLEDQRLIRSFLSLAGAGDLLRDSIELGNDAFRDNTALTEEAEKRYATVASELQILINSIKVFAIEIGNTLLPAIRAGADMAQTLVKWFTDMPEPLRIATVALTGLVGGFTLLGGAALIIIPKIAATAKAIRDLRLAVLALRTANMAGAVGGATAGTGAVAAAGGVGVVAAGAAAVVGIDIGIRAAQEATDDWGDSANTWQRALGGYIEGLETWKVVIGDFSGAARGAGLALEGMNTGTYTDALGGVTNAYGTSASSAIIYTDALGGVTNAYGTSSASALIAVTATDKVASSQWSAEKATRAHQVALASLGDFLARQISPVLAARGALTDLADAQKIAEDAARDHGKESEEFALAQVELALKTAIAQDALGTFGANAPLSIDAVATALGISDEAAQALLETLGLLDGMTITTTIITDQINTTSETSGAFWAPPTPPARGRGWGQISERAAGGPVSAGRPYMVGERGPEMMVPNQSGTILPNGWNRPNSTIVIQSPMNDFAQDLQLATILATVNTMVEVQN